MRLNDKVFHIHGDCCRDCNQYVKGHCFLFMTYKRDYNSVPKKCREIEAALSDGKTVDAVIVYDKNRGYPTTKIKIYKK